MLSIWEISENGGVDPISTEDLYFSDNLKEKINRLDDLYHSLFIDNKIEFTYIGEQHPEIEQEITKLQAEIAQEIRSELKDGKELFKEGLANMLEKLEPKLVLVYGPMPKSIFRDYEKEWNFLHFKEWTHLVHTQESKNLLK